MVDQTDFDFYRSNPDQIRLVDRVVDPISLAKEEIRASTFQSSFEDKASYYQNIMDAGLVGRHGMVLNRMSPGGAEQPDQDGALWTGIYAYTQALRYRLSGDAVALSNLRKSLHGLFTSWISREIRGPLPEHFGSPGPHSPEARCVEKAISRTSTGLRAATTI